MKHLAMLTLLLLSIALRFDLANAQTPVNVCRSELFVTANRAQGKLVRVGETLVFIDDYMDASFSIDKNNINGWSQQEGVFSIYTRRLVRFRSIQERHFAFRLISGNCDSIASWLRRIPLTQGTSRLPVRPKTYWARLKRRMGRDIDGKLEILEKTIAFKPNRGAEYLHRWDLRDIEIIERKAPYVLEITPSESDKYRFELQDKGISSEEVNAIRDRISKQRLGVDRFQEKRISATNQHE